MEKTIHILPQQLADKIAAGEVVGRPASAVKELIENSIDANATSISVVIKDGGTSLIQVIDNGIGMSAEDARLAFARHATSKIASYDDLENIRTLGFRAKRWHRSQLFLMLNCEHDFNRRTSGQK